MSMSHLTYVQSDITSVLSDITSVYQIVYIQEPKLQQFSLTIIESQLISAS
jgi:hypothetical protein